ncbi:hypothetical protein U1Q18_036420 [Sarracenia purpurea var. burkii]
MKIDIHIFLGAFRVAVRVSGLKMKFAAHAFCASVLFGRLKLGFGSFRWDTCSGFRQMEMYGASRALRWRSPSTDELRKELNFVSPVKVNPKSIWVEKRSTGAVKEEVEADTHHEVKGGLEIKKEAVPEASNSGPKESSMDEDLVPCATINRDYNHQVYLSKKIWYHVQL